MDVSMNPIRRHRNFAAMSVLLFFAAAYSTTRATQPVLPVSADPLPASPDSPPRPVALPGELLGVWFRDDPGGQAQCTRYRALPADIGESDELWMSMVGSLVITPDLIHEFSEYGEGNFNAIRGIESAGDGSWRVEVQVGVDQMPVGDAAIETHAYRIGVRQGRLGWQPLGAGDERGPLFFRCGNVRGDAYRIGQEAPAGEAR